MAGKYYIRAEASQSRGFGHLKRCIVLAKALRAMGAEPVFLVQDSDNKAIDILKIDNLPFHKIPSAKSYVEEVASYPQDCKNLIVDLVHRDTISDKPNFKRYLQTLKDTGMTVALLEGLFDEALHIPDMPKLDCVLQPYLGAEKDIKPNCDLWLCGGQYALLDERYSKLPNRTIRADAKNVLITLGGADPQGITATALQGLTETALNIRVIIGPYFSAEHRATIEKLSSRKSNIELIIGRNDLITDYDWADIALGGSGTSRYEFAATGLPALFVSIYPYHERLSREFTHTGIAGYLGYYQDVGPQDWLDASISLLNNVKSRQAMSSSGYKYIDSQGANRLGKILIENVF